MSDPAPLRRDHAGVPLSRPPDLSFVIPAYNEAGNIAETLRRVAAKAAELVDHAEIIVVDDGSTDATIAEIRATALPVPVTTLRLSRNFGKEQAIMAGLDRSCGRAVVIVDADLQEPLRYVDEMMRHYRDGYEMIYGVRAHRRDESWRKRAFTRAFYAVLNIGSEAEIPADARDFRLMDRKVVDALCSLPERNRFMKGLYGWVGFRTLAIPVEIDRRGAGASKFNTRGLFRLGFTGITGFTNWPLRIWTAIGMGLATLSIFYGGWILAKTLIWGRDLPGFATLAVAVFFLGGVQLISIGVLGEYLARVFNEVKGRPGYLIAEEIETTEAAEEPAGERE
jgi:polyisoprenyl-phosphate glycosyltransferase